MTKLVKKTKKSFIWGVQKLYKYQFGCLVTRIVLLSLGFSKSENHRPDDDEPKAGAAMAVGGSSGELDGLGVIGQRRTRSH